MSGRENVEVKKSQIVGAGRGLFALKDFQAGDLVLAIDRPLVAELDVDRLSDSCAWCFQRGETDPASRAQAASMGLPNGFVEVKSCAGCHRIAYCSKSCQSKAWKREHKYECKIIAPKQRPDLPDGVRAVIKLLGRLKADPRGENANLLEILQFGPFTAGSGLDDFKQQNPKLFDDLSMLSYGAWKYAGEPKLETQDSQAIAKAFLFNVGTCRPHDTSQDKLTMSV
jgi:SET and MYND domain-containing protein